MPVVSLRSLSRGGWIGMGCLALCGTAGNGAVILEAGGWRAEVDDSLVSSVDLFVDFVSDDLIVIEKFAQFRTVSAITGRPDSINITFTQIAPDADTVPQILVTDEAVTNLTGVDWEGFEVALLDSGNATFNQALSETFTIAPFDTRTYTDDSTTVSYLSSGAGIIPDDSTWFPGAANGELVIDLDTSGEQPLVFTLKELPIPVPAPAVSTLAMLTLGFGAARRRRVR